MAVDNIRGPQLSTWQRVALRTGYHKQTMEKLPQYQQFVPVIRSGFGHGAIISQCYWSGVTAATSVDGVGSTAAPLPKLEDTHINSADKTVTRYLKISHKTKWLRRAFSVLPLAGFSMLAYLNPAYSATSLFSSSAYLGLGGALNAVIWSLNILVGAVSSLVVHFGLRALLASNPFSNTKNNVQELFVNNLEALAYALKGLNDKQKERVLSLFDQVTIEVKNKVKSKVVDQTKRNILNKLIEAISYVDAYRDAQAYNEAIDTKKYNTVAIDKLLTEVREQIKGLIPAPSPVVIDALEAMKTQMGALRPQLLTDFISNKGTISHEEYYQAAKLIRELEGENPPVEVRVIIENAKQRIISEYDPAFIIGQTFKGKKTLPSEYEIVAKAGAGGMGAVYKIRTVDGSGQASYFAVKFPSFTEILSPLQRVNEAKAINPHDATLTKKQEDLLDLLKRFGNEASELCTKIANRSRSIIRVVDEGTTSDLKIEGYSDHVPFYIAEYLDGISLAEAFRKFTLLQTVKNILIPIGEALTILHDNSIWHRDIKPDNLKVVLSPDKKAVDRAVLFDFGALLDLSEEADPKARLTKTDQRLGTFPYMNPEYIFTGIVDHNTDLYSWALTVYHSFVGGEPAKNLAERPASLPAGSIDSNLLLILDTAYQKKFTSAAHFVQAFKVLETGLEAHRDAGEIHRQISEVIKPGPVGGIPLSHEQKVTKFIDYLTRGSTDDKKGLCVAITDGGVTFKDEKGNDFEIEIDPLDKKQLLKLLNAVNELRSDAQVEADAIFARDYLEGEILRR